VNTGATLTTCARGWSIDLQTVTEIDTHVRNTRLVGVREEHKIARLRIGNRRGRIELIDRDTRQVDADRGVHVFDQTTAIHTAA
jgi:hypothetical protein